MKPAEGTFNKSCGQFQPLHGPGFTLFIYTPRHAGEKSERPGKGAERETERVNRQQLSKGKKQFRNRGIHWCFPLLLLLSLNSWRKCLIKIFVLLCLSEMTYDSSLSQTQNSHSICHSHPVRDSHSPWKMEQHGGKMQALEQQASDPRQSQLHRPSPRLRLDRRVLKGEAGEAHAMPCPQASAVLLSPHSQEHEAHLTQGFHNQGSGQDLSHPRHYLVKV